MSILINGMEMPKGGEMIVVFSDGTVHKCLLGVREELEKSEAVPVPPHGRCIDAKKAYEDAITQVSLAFVSNNKEQAAMAVANVIRNAPTIIEAEEGET